MSVVSSKAFYFSYQQELKQYLLVSVLFVIWPFGTFLYSFLNLGKRWSAMILILFTAIFGYTMIAETGFLDLHNIQNSLIGYSGLDLRDLFYSNPFSDSPDIYRDIVSFLISRFTLDGNWLMLVFGLVAGYSYTRVLSLFTEKTKTANLYFYLLLFIFSCIVGLDQLGGVRFGLAAYVFFYGAIRVINNGEKRYLVVSALSVLIHFSFWSVFLLLLGFIFLKRFPLIIYLILILSFVLPNFLQSYIMQFSGLFGQSIENRAETYSNLVSELNYDAQSVWFVRYRIPIMIYFSYFMLLITRLRKKSLRFNYTTDILFLFTLLMLSFVNFTINIPHLGYRFRFVYLMFVIFYLFKVYINNPESPLARNMVFLSFLSSFLMIALTIRAVLYYTPLTLFASSLPGIFFHQQDHSVWVNFFE